MLKFVKQIEINLSICPKKANGGKIAGFAYFKYLTIGRVGGMWLEANQKSGMIDLWEFFSTKNLR